MMRPYLKKILSASLGALIFALASCGAEDASLVFENIESSQNVEEGDEIEVHLEPIDPVAEFERSPFADNAVSTEHFAVTKQTFDVLFNYILIRQLEPNDGDYDEYDGYFDTGALDRTGSVSGQTVPGKDVFWFSDASSRALGVTFETLRIFEFAREYGHNAYSGANERRVNAELNRIREGKYGGELSAIFSGADERDVYLALVLKFISDNPSAIGPYKEYETYPPTEYDVAEGLSPVVFDGFYTAATFFQQK